MKEALAIIASLTKVLHLTARSGTFEYCGKRAQVLPHAIILSQLRMAEGLDEIVVASDRRNDGDREA